MKRETVVNFFASLAIFIKKGRGRGREGRRRKGEEEKKGEGEEWNGEEAGKTNETRHISC